MHSPLASKHLIAAAVAAVAASSIGAATDLGAAEMTLRATSNIPTRVAQAGDFVKWTKAVNAAAKGLFQIKYLGGPEVTPSQKQGQATRTGIIDLNFGVASFYKGIVPHVDAMVGSTIDAVEARKQGHLDYLDGIWRKRINAHYLGWFSSRYGWHIYLTQAPKMKPDGGIDFSGLKIRASPSTRDFIKALGATVGLIHSTEVYTALERGVVNGNVFPALGITNYGWQKFLKWRLDPVFLQTNLVVMVNLDKWNALPRKGREILQRMAIENEQSSIDFLTRENRKELDRLKAAGMQVVPLKGMARESYLKTARAVFWNRLAKSVPDEVAELRRRFYQ